MSSDTINEALTTVRRRVETNRGIFGLHETSAVLSTFECMRDYLMKEDIAGFEEYVSQKMAKSPDTMDFILEELFIELGIDMSPANKDPRSQFDAMLYAQ